jgi:molybdate transport system ATP-binding protein
VSADSLSVRLQQAAPIPLQLELDVHRGELLALVGPSGSGKTTVLRSIAGLYQPQSGFIRCNTDVWLDSRSGIHTRPQRRRVGLVFQDYALFPHLSVRDNITVAMSGRTRSEREHEALRLLERVHLKGLEARFPRELSGGQQQRVAVARALAREPRVLLLDEPFSAVDHMTRQRLQNELARLRRQIEVPIILVTHDLTEASALADRICVLHNGEALQADEPDELFRRPRTPQVARLIGCYNVFTGTLIHKQDRAWLQWGTYELELVEQPDMAEGTRVHWFIPDADILLHRRGRPSLGERENPVAGVVEECVRLGAQTEVILRCAGTRQPLRLQISTHAARRNDVHIGAQVKVSLLADGIHVMGPAA